MTNITFIDLEVNPVNRQILDMGAEMGNSYWRKRCTGYR